jgi:hypothetical protein
MVALAVAARRALAARAETHAQWHRCGEYRLRQDLDADVCVGPERERVCFCGSSGNGVAFGTGGYLTIQSGGQTRGFAVRLPDNYNPSTPYWLIFGFHWNGGNSAQVDNGGTSGYDWSYYGLQKQSKNGAIFVAPDGLKARLGEFRRTRPDLHRRHGQTDRRQLLCRHDTHHLDGVSATAAA